MILCNKYEFNHRFWRHNFLFMGATFEGKVEPRDRCKYRWSLRTVRNQTTVLHLCSPKMPTSRQIFSTFAYEVIFIINKGGGTFWLKLVHCMALGGNVYNIIIQYNYICNIIYWNRVVIHESSEPILPDHCGCLFRSKFQYLLVCNGWAKYKVAHSGTQWHTV